MADQRIVCTIQSDWLKVGHGHILSVGIGGNSGWNHKESVQDVINTLELGLGTYYTFVDNKRADVTVYRCGQCQHKTIRSQADGYWNNNLDALPECRG